MQVRQSRIFFFKQWGVINKKKSGHSLHGRMYDEMPFKWTIYSRTDQLILLHSK